jgi:hypothetical protein
VTRIVDVNVHEYAQADADEHVFEGTRTRMGT